MFNELKTAQMAAFFLKKERGCRTEYLKIIKLLYLSERLHLDRYHSPMTGDCLSSLDHGPVVSTTYNCIKKEKGQKGITWHEWIGEKNKYTISLKKDFNNIEELDELSEADLEIMSEVWDKFGWMSWTQIRDYTHDNCPEWKDPEGSSIPIEYRDVLKALGYGPDRIKNIEASIKESCSSIRLTASY